MTRKDIIIIAVLANIGMLAILFMLAFRDEDSKTQEQTEINYSIAEISSEPIQESGHEMVKVEPRDEVDSVLDELSNNSIHSYLVDEGDASQHIGHDSSLDQQHVQENFNKQSSDDFFVEIAIKRGDALEKIARANGTTVEAIKKANHLTSDRLKIGQILQIPVNTQPKNTQISKPSVVSASSNHDAEYYIIKSGDNPWKIAKQYQIKVDEFLKLNDLDEDTARNLKIGDRIRVR
jgi:peptidoglycan DL-endopeptidase LytF